MSLHSRGHSVASLGASRAGSVATAHEGGADEQVVVQPLGTFSRVNGSLQPEETANPVLWREAGEGLEKGLLVL